MHFDGQSAYIYSEEDILLIIQATDAVVKKVDRPVPFHESKCYKPSKTLFDKPHARHLQHAAVLFLKSTPSVETTFQQTKTASR